MSASRKSRKRQSDGQRISREIHEIRKLRPHHKKLGMETLEDRRLLSVGSKPADHSFLPSNVESNLAAYCGTMTSATVSGASSATNDANSANSTWRNLLQIDQMGSALVDVWARSSITAVAQAVAVLGGQIQGTYEAYHLVEAWLAPEDVAEAAAAPGVLSITPVYRPMLRAGSVQTEGDAVIHGDTVANDLRAGGRQFADAVGER